MAAALDYVIELWPYFNSDASELDWTHGIDHMFNTGAPGDADAPCAMTVMGDWAKGYLQSEAGLQASISSRFHSRARAH
jgi:hypothetical protein